jgi:hypothetical protein
MVNLHPAVVLDNVARTTPPRHPAPAQLVPPSILDAVERTPRGRTTIRPSCLWTGFLLGLAAAGLALALLTH